ncbi:hypothetical protein SELMODRAFT_440968 [Selaginella moellendorffii]|uniref:Uncharacterized protein n=1 Tax=Selaginella moellendorffii TaxID=88036 RepID=D8RFR9_SELML|nr:uncharacterized protein LOC9645546 [Selaginella moellendorffii]XP_024530467.1 uncharacterized protein LOC9645546 [Selaginella moellendorffii]EFJ29168.1 hypothetical protein SELMODRAFT_440968 [Selaginella moellendorffii]|eukprot:XP_002970044.1 uncharacterized protein LOC9645546 [Selaginella moellendorffii]
MDARDFVKLSVAGLGLRINPASTGTGGTDAGSSSLKRRSRTRSLGRIGIPSSSNCFFCEIRFPGCQPQTSQVPLVFGEPDSRSVAANFYIDATVFNKLLSPNPASCLLRVGSGSAPSVELVVYAGRQGYGNSSGSSISSKVLGVFRVPISADSDWTDGLLLHGGWVKMGSFISGMELHAAVKLESDPRYEFQFDGDIALSPQIVQVKGKGAGKKQQPVFSCKFSKGRTRMVQGDLTPSRTPREESGNSRERKSWLVTIHDLSGSPVAAASMVTPFVPFTGSDEVSRSNPGGWLILVPDSCSSATDVVHGGHSYYSWRAWGRLEAWRQDGGRLGLKFQLISHTGSILVSETTIPSSNKAGEFSIDTGPSVHHSPLPSPRSSGDCSFYLGLPTTDSGFVMNCELRRGGSGSGRRSNSTSSSSASRATVQLSTRYITCVEDAAVFMALAAAVDLSRDACQPFSRKLRKELCRDFF